MDTSLQQYTRIKKMSFPQFRRWMTEFGQACFTEGLRTGEKEGAWWSDDEVYQILRAEHIGHERARRITDRLAEGSGTDAPPAAREEV